MFRCCPGGRGRGGHRPRASFAEPGRRIGWNDSVLRFARYGYPARLEASRCTAAGLITGRRAC
jgi:hypothetical protein